jgi:hypothetical protein
MADTYTTTITTPAISTTGTRKRTLIGDKVRNLFPGNNFLVLIESGLPKMEEVSQKKGLIKKRKVDNSKFEAFTYTPVAVEFTVATFSSVASFTVSSATGLRPKMLLMNTSNKTLCRIGTITSTTIGATTVGSTTFTASATDKLLALSFAYEENSSSPYMFMKDEDNLYNVTQIMRFPASISNTAGGNPHYGKETYWSRVKERVLVEGLRRASHNMIFGERPSTGEKTTDAILGDTFGSFRGLWNWSTHSYDAGGNMTFEKFQTELAYAMSDNIGMDTKMVMLCGVKVWGDILQWHTDKLALLEPGDYKYFGAQSKKLLMARGYIDVMPVDVFDRGDLYKNCVIFNPDDVEYVYKNKGPGDKHDRDFHPKLGIQNPDVDGVEDEILGEISLSVVDGGEKITTITNWLA